MTGTLADPDLVSHPMTGDETMAELTASRSRIATSADQERRRLQHQLHRGAQQRLMHAIIALKLARDALAAGCPPTDLIDEALTQAERASIELGDVVRGILPTALVHGGLHTGLESLIADLALEVEMRVAVPRLPAATETTAYLVIAEALTNAAEHVCAARVGVRVELDGDVLVVEVRADGADKSRGLGLTGLIDRVDAAGGTVTITNAPGAGTVLRAALPVEDA
jgi:signal transduction histidine kinase